MSSTELRRGTACRRGRLGVVVCAISAFVAMLATAACGRGAAGPPAFGIAVTSGQSWSSWGHDLANTRNQPLESILKASNVGKLTEKWTYTTAGYVSATPTVAGGVVYFPDSAGYLYALNSQTGALVWKMRISSYDGVANSRSRDSPVIWGNYVILGDRGNNGGANQSISARVFAVNRFTGQLVWMTQVANHHAAQITASPVVANKMVIVGVSSYEEGDAESDSYPCCTFRGRVVALSAKTGAIQWTTYMVPRNNGPCTGNQAGVGPVGCGYSGAAVLGSPAVDATTGQVFVGTGNNYSTPDSATACENTAVSSGTSDANCTAATDYFDAVVAMTLSNGRVEWGHKVEGWDASNLACVNGPRSDLVPLRHKPGLRLRRQSEHHADHRRQRQAGDRGGNRTEEWHLLDARCRYGENHLALPGRPRQRGRRNHVGHRLRRPQNLRPAVERAPRELQPWRAGWTPGDRGLMGGTQPADGSVRLASSYARWTRRLRPGQCRQRSRVRRGHGPQRRQHVRARRGHRKDSFGALRPPGQS